MNTYFGLLAEFDGRAEIPLEEVAPRYFGINARTASMRAGAQALPVPVYRAGDSQKSPWLVSAVDLAKYLDEKRDEARQLWQRVNT
ncbi:pyocin activator protein PrtN [Halomonas sp. MCCC 1A17488]|uniref:pyocin activator PrtN family protein n=1 Tax=unclassified Halomonas TaxID=2609666 RepID=UPI0018D24C3F|nr:MULTISPECIES: pyocin activator PrtN family protein [unclassified Halomonas]MCE8015945.1 pyocin activator protein PrtN [Halomonas sp. MCCC 1A17488]MCG3239278.1 pyocin activator protein PrtN [Halomonas sp. MCCC 1A17488]QPP50789.1 pyocin activator PrtN family protein [Halomonas sp. SS10-MC5]